MPTKRCQFVYIRAKDGYVGGGRCENSVHTRVGDFCRKHLENKHRYSNRNLYQHSERGIESAHAIASPPLSSNEFPRVHSREELQAWVEEARQRTDPKANWRRGCIVCGRSTMDSDMTSVTGRELKELKERLEPTLARCYGYIDASVLEHGGALYEADGLPIDRNGQLSAEESVLGSPFVGRACKSCYEAMAKGKVPHFCLGNGLWSGVELDTPLKDLTWIEEKLVARVHVSVQIQKCRMFRAWAADGFHPQRQVQGHILSYPMEPTTVLQRLPLSPNRLVGLIKVVFVSKRRISQHEAINLRFYVVRREKVVNALRWLIQHNPQYRDIELDEDAIAQLPANGIPDAVYQHFTFSDQVDAGAAGHSRYDMSDQGRIRPHL